MINRTDFGRALEATREDAGAVALVGIDTLFIHALSENAAMLKIARNAGAVVERDGPEAQAYLKLPPDNLATHVDEAIVQQIAELDYQFKRQARRIEAFLGSLSEVNANLET